MLTLLGVSIFAHKKLKFLSFGNFRESEIFNQFCCMLDGLAFLIINLQGSHFLKFITSEEAAI